MALQLHNDLLSIISIRSSIIDTLSLSLLPSSQNRDILGSWLVAALEEGKRSGGSGLKTWEDCTVWSESVEESSVAGRMNLTCQIVTLAEYLSLSILDPATLHHDIHPAPVASVELSTKGARVRAAPSDEIPEEADEIIQERWARYRVGGLTGLAWVLPKQSTSAKEVSRLLQDPQLWTTLSSVDPSLGLSQPPVRRAAYALLSVLINVYPEEVAREGTLELLSKAVLGNCWLEKEATVWETAGPAVVQFLSSKGGLHRSCLADCMSQSIESHGR